MWFWEPRDRFSLDELKGPKSLCKNLVVSSHPGKHSHGSTVPIQLDWNQPQFFNALLTESALLLAELDPQLFPIQVHRDVDQKHYMVPMSDGRTRDLHSAAVKHLKQALAIAPDILPALLPLVQLLLAVHDIKGAVDTIDKCSQVTYSSDYFQELYDLAVELIKRDRPYVDHQKFTCCIVVIVPPDSHGVRSIGFCVGPLIIKHTGTSATQVPLKAFYCDWKAGLVSLTFRIGVLHRSRTTLVLDVYCLVEALKDTWKAEVEFTLQEAKLRSFRSSQCLSFKPFGELRCGPNSEFAKSIHKIYKYFVGTLAVY
ncbi:unnamed protein product [Calypogeia fissa]